MPRRPVRPQDRQRVVRACDPCKASKKRCNGEQPCSACERKGNTRSCCYTAGRRHHPLPRTSSVPLQHVSQENTSTCSTTNLPQRALISPNGSWEGNDQCVRSPSSPCSIDADTRQTRPEEYIEDSTQDSSSDSLDQPPVMLSSVNGEKVFIGNTAAISFLRFLQRTLERNAGTSCFTDAQESHRLFEAETTSIGSSAFYDSMSLEDRISFIQSFLDASAGLLDLYSWEEVSQMLNLHCPTIGDKVEPTAERLNSLQSASLYLMVAIGAQCCGRSRADVTYAADLFSFARKLALEGMLETPSLDLVRVFILMAFYMCGACRRNSAFMYLGVASKSADILGLCVSTHYNRLSSDSRDKRLRTAKSLRVFDVICNSILGRPTSTSPVPSDSNSHLIDDNSMTADVKYKALALGAAYEVTSILDVSVTKSAAGDLNSSEAETLLLALQQRSRSFPTILRQLDGETMVSGQSVTIGNIHVSGVYYFSVIIVTRHFLIQHVVPQLSRHARSSIKNHHSLHRDPTTDVKVARLADACVEAATYMAQMCYQVMKSGQLMGNMCIIKAWMFATGLVLGFSFLAETGDTRTNRQAAFLKTLQVLGDLKRLSPQAEQYYNILANFHQAIKAYHAQVQQEEQILTPKLVDQIFLPDITHELGPEVIGAHLPSPDMSILDSGSIDWQEQVSLNILNEGVNIEPPFLGEHDVIVQMLWELDAQRMSNPEPSLLGTELGFLP
ncbi:hypothetical protein BU24DRAFT_475544 [Aaosphaeria arxii CBS 175.79]|uniref:Zn(2)-C6 fungal-type domain-containing protein n=1 Tax=Aaosphaeria arxii CBS 175.79 TaxID=1450172 RepID=A0A6A5X5V2_9PLEO|nr:uncharacterized protein BU24DRAFT_475544 [Aaosphaeria arxii CBS 175.79]KAF2008375.1 hypothetical protein BU24DRAFT_475544 [Aaosphaeria arxii CBS 175.79]